MWEFIVRERGTRPFVHQFERVLKHPKQISNKPYHDPHVAAIVYKHIGHKQSYNHTQSIKNKITIY